MALSLDTTIGAGGIIIVEGTGATITTASFSTAANIRLVALVSSNGNASSDTSLTVSGGGLSWATEVTTGSTSATDDGMAIIALAYSASALSGITIACNQGGGGVSGQAMTVIGILGAETTHGGAEAITNVESGVPTVGLTTTRAGSYVLATSADWSQAGNYVVGGAQSPAGTLLNTHDVAGQYSGGQWRTTSTVGSSSTAVTMECTITRDQVSAAIEIRETAGGAVRNAIQTVGGRGMIQAIYPTASG